MINLQKCKEINLDNNVKISEFLDKKQKLIEIMEEIPLHYFKKD